MIALSTLLDVTARAFGVDACALRSPGDDRGAEARAAFCYLATGLTQALDDEIGVVCALRPEMVAHEREWLAGLLNRARDLDETVFSIEVEARTLDALSEKIGIRTPPAAHPFAIAKKLLASERAAMAATAAEILSVAAALVALAGSRPAPKSDLALAAERYERSRRTMADALFTRDERPARRAHDAALTNLKQLIGA